MTWQDGNPGGNLLRRSRAPGLNDNGFSCPPMCQDLPDLTRPIQIICERKAPTLFLIYIIQWIPRLPAKTSAALLEPAWEALVFALTVVVPVIFRAGERLGDIICAFPPRQTQKSAIPAATFSHHCIPAARASIGEWTRKFLLDICGGSTFGGTRYQLGCFEGGSRFDRL